MKDLFFIIALLAAPNAFAALFGEERSWEFIQSVGGISIEKPKLENNEWLLPVFCNVAGLRKITIKPTGINSALVWADTEVRIKKDIINISIETAVAGMGGESSDCGPARLGKLKPGKYKVMYLSPDKSTNSVGEIEIGL